MKSWRWSDLTDIRNYISILKKRNQLKVVKKTVSPKFEIAAITAKADGKEALFFKNIQGKKFSLVSNLVGNRNRFALAVGAKDDTIHEKVIRAIEHAKKPKKNSKPKFLENKSKDGK